MAMPMPMANDAGCDLEKDLEKENQNEILYLEVECAATDSENGCHEDNHHFTLLSLTALFLREYCQYKQASLVLVRREKGSHEPLLKLKLKESGIGQLDTEEVKQGNSCGKTGKPEDLLKIPEFLKPCSIQSQECLPRVVRECQLPCILLCGGLMCVSGLANVLRHIIQTSSSRQPQRNLEALLGFRQTCLKGLSETSVWTKLCEVDTPDQISSLLHVQAPTSPQTSQDEVQDPGPLQASLAQDLDVEHPQISEAQDLDLEQFQTRTCPPCLGKLEELLAQPVSTFNSEKLRRKLLKNQQQAGDKKGGKQGGSEEGEENDRCSGASGDTLHTEFKTKLHLHNKKEHRQLKREQRARNNAAVEGENSEGIKLQPVEPNAVEVVARVLDDTPVNISTRSNATERERSEGIKLEPVEPNQAEVCARVSDDTPSNISTESGENAVRTSSDSNERSGRRRRKQRNRTAIEKNSLPELTHTFSQGASVTVADFALFIPIHLYLHTCLVNGTIHRACRAIPSVVDFYSRMWDVPSVRQVVSTCFGFREVPVPVVDSQTAKRGGEDESREKHKSESLLSAGDIQPGVGNLGVGRPVVRELLKKCLPGVMSSLETQGILATFEPHPSLDTGLDWRAMPPAVSPLHGELKGDRAIAKEQQIECILAAVRGIARDGDRILDFCSGGGHLGIAIAYSLPGCHVIMIENKDESLRRALERVQTLELTNVSLYLSNIDYFYGSFNIGVSLHACGVATDIVLSKCVEQGASFVSSPCCYGALHDTHHMTYPRSQVYRNSTISKKDYFLLGHGAEQTSRNFDGPFAKQGKKCMGYIDVDRAELARENGYQVTLCSLEPQTCSPKNNLLIGIAPRDILTGGLNTTQK